MPFNFGGTIALKNQNILGNCSDDQLSRRYGFTTVEGHERIYPEDGDSGLTMPIMFIQDGVFENDFPNSPNLTESFYRNMSLLPCEKTIVIYVAGPGGRSGFVDGDECNQNSYCYQHPSNQPNLECCSSDCTSDPPGACDKNCSSVEPFLIDCCTCNWGFGGSGVLHKIKLTFQDYQNVNPMKLRVDRFLAAPLSLYNDTTATYNNIQVSLLDGDTVVGGFGTQQATNGSDGYVRKVFGCPETSGGNPVFSCADANCCNPFNCEGYNGDPDEPVAFDLPFTGVTVEISRLYGGGPLANITPLVPYLQSVFNYEFDSSEERFEYVTPITIGTVDAGNCEVDESVVFNWGRNSFMTVAISQDPADDINPITEWEEASFPFRLAQVKGSSTIEPGRKIDIFLNPEITNAGPTVGNFPTPLWDAGIEKVTINISNLEPYPNDWPFKDFTDEITFSGKEGAGISYQQLFGTLALGITQTSWAIRFWPFVYDPASTYPSITTGHILEYDTVVKSFDNPRIESRVHPNDTVVWNSSFAMKDIFNDWIYRYASHGTTGMWEGISYGNGFEYPNYMWAVVTETVGPTGPTGA